MNESVLNEQSKFEVTHDLEMIKAFSEDAIAALKCEDFDALKYYLRRIPAYINYINEEMGWES